MNSRLDVSYMLLMLFYAKNMDEENNIDKGKSFCSEKGEESVQLIHVNGLEHAEDNDESEEVGCQDGHHEVFAALRVRRAWEEDNPTDVDFSDRPPIRDNKEYISQHFNGCVYNSVPINLTGKSNDERETNSVNDFTICKNCLSNRRKEFTAEGDEGLKGIETCISSPSKEICICPNSGVNDCDRFMFECGKDAADEPSTNQTVIATPCHRYNINDLPDEIMLNIFSYFTPTELCRYVAPVCVTWLSYARDSTLWEVIEEQEFKDVSSELLVKVILSWCSLLRVLDIKGRTDLNKADFEAIFRSCPLIEVISFAFCTQVNDDILKLLSIYCANLTFVNFEGCQISDASLMYLIGKPIHSLNLSHCNLISDEGLIFVAKNFKDIASINVDGIQWISSTSIEILINEQHDSLTEIQLDGDDLMDECVSMLSQLQNIRVLSISFCDGLTDLSLEEIKHLKNLKHLQLKKGLNFSNNAMLGLINNLKCLEGPGLMFLGLSECSSLSDQCLKAISESCPNLTVLNLSWCWEVTDDGINFILDSCHKVKELHLCGLHELYGIPLRRVPCEMPKLKFIDLRQCNKVSDDLLADLSNEMKTLTILNYYGDVVKPTLNFWNQESKCCPGHFHHTSY